MIAECGKRNAESRIDGVKGTQSSSSIRNLQSQFRSAFTLVELLVTIVIIAILAAALLGASNAAFESARRSKTKSIITKIDGLLMQKYQSFTTRRVNINPAHRRYIDNVLAASAITQRQHGQMLADLRLLAIRELMKLEMPDRWSDITGEVTTSAPIRPIFTTAPYPWILEDRPAICKTYARRFASVENKVASDSSIDASAIIANQSAECLYLTIMLACGDGEAADLFSEQDIADTDGDGAPEFIDGWGQPIQFVRWPAGYELSNLMAFDAAADPDPFDPFRRDSVSAQRPPKGAYPAPVQPHIDEVIERNSRSPALSAYRLVPLIFSRGADGDSDVFVSSGSTAGLDPYSDQYQLNNNDTQMAIVNDGELDGEGWVDNITNHNLEQ